MSRRLPVVLALASAILAILPGRAPAQSAEPFRLEKQARIVLLGNGLGSRMIHSGQFET